MSSTQITDAETVSAFIADANPGWLFKHSNACGVSHAAFGAYAEFLASHDDQRAAHIVIQTHRPLSNQIASELGVVHKSPQLFLVRGGSVLWQASHWSITAQAMADAWAGATAG